MTNRIFNYTKQPNHIAKIKMYILIYEIACSHTKKRELTIYYRPDSRYTSPRISFDPFASRTYNSSARELDAPSYIRYSNKKHTNTAFMMTTEAKHLQRRRRIDCARTLHTIPYIKSLNILITMVRSFAYTHHK